VFQINLKTKTRDRYVGNYEGLVAVVQIAAWSGYLTWLNEVADEVLGLNVENVYVATDGGDVVTIPAMPDVSYAPKVAALAKKFPTLHLAVQFGTRCNKDDVDKVVATIGSWKMKKLVDFVWFDIPAYESESKSGPIDVLKIITTLVKRADLVSKTAVPVVQFDIWGTIAL
jgi:hypothetical protein